MNTSRHPGDNLGSKLCKAEVICRLIRLRTTALLLTFVLMEMPIRVLARRAESVTCAVWVAVSKEGFVKHRGFKALNVK
jgi:hypothetical protein